jgi:Cof subfamily protein (haloacid dehalogenase superfamily)
MPYKLLVTDLDSTLLTTQRTLSQRIQHAFEQAKQRGKYITFATGRNYVSSLPMIQMLRPNAPLILYNGSRIEENCTRNIVYAKNLPREKAFKAFELNTRYGIHISMYLDDEIYVETLTPETLEFMAKEQIVCHPVADLATFLGERDPIKLLLIGEPEKLTPYALEYSAIAHDTQLMRSELNYLEILASGVSKGNALAYLASYLGISVSEIIAIGDNPNDIEMIREAGLGVAVLNAHPDVKQVADLITDSNDNDGVAKIIEEYLLS